MNSFLNDEPRVGLIGNHEHRPNLMGWVQLTVFLPCFIIGTSAYAADKGAELANGGIMTNECVSEKCTGVRSLVVGVVQSAFLKESEGRVKCASKTICGNSEPSSILAGNGQSMRHEQHAASPGDAKQPEINTTQQDAEYVHPSIWIWMGIIVYLLVFQAPENTVLASQKPNYK